MHTIAHKFFFFFDEQKQNDTKEMTSSHRRSSIMAHSLFYLLALLTCASIANAWLAPLTKHSTKSLGRRLQELSVATVAAPQRTVSTAAEEDATKIQERCWTDSNVHNLTSEAVSSSETRKKWEELVPNPLSLNSKGCDVTVVFDHPREGAKRLAKACFASSTPPQAIVDQLETSMASFLENIQALLPHLSHQQQHALPKCKARIVATRGFTGAKCPRWHLDHVPFRYIQSLVGPGCEYVIGEKGLRRDALNGLDLVDIPVKQLNALMVDEVEADIRQAQEGQAILLMGKAWAKQQNREGSCKSNAALSACVHKSPELKPWEGRVLLSMDVVEDEHH